MSAYVEYEFQRGFILDEERIRRINELILSRVPKESGYPPLIYKVYRSDSFTYTTRNVQEVIDEDNSESRKIKAILIEINEDDKKEGRSNLTLQLSFETGEETSLTVKGEDRDLVFLLYSDLRQYVAMEVATCKRVTGAGIGMAALLISMAPLFLGILAFAVVGLQVSQSTSAVTTALNSQDFNYKLNYLIEVLTKYLGGSTVFSPFMVISVVLLGITNLVKKQQWAQLSTILFVQDVFLFGKGMKRFNDRQKRWGNILWVVIVGTIVSIVAGIIVWLMTSR